jgi:Double zinc ribbon
MHEEDSGVPDGPVSPCGHRNPPSAHFCDVCGVRLPMQCPSCRAINRGEANFCSTCGRGLRDSEGAHATSGAPPTRSLRWRTLSWLRTNSSSCASGDSSSSKARNVPDECG